MDSRAAVKMQSRWLRSANLNCFLKNQNGGKQSVWSRMFEVHPLVNTQRRRLSSSDPHTTCAFVCAKGRRSLHGDIHRIQAMKDEIGIVKLHKHPCVFLFQVRQFVFVCGICVVI